MNAESRRVIRTEVWTDWERHVVNGVYPLRRFLGGTDHSAVFLTAYTAEHIPDAAIKLVPVESIHTETQLLQWGAAVTLSHAHLLQLYDVGRCHIGGRGHLFVVMEFAEQTLSQVLPARALSPDEARELVIPTLDALTYLHKNYLIHGQLKPSNFLVVKDQLKLAADTIRPIGMSNATRSNVYEPPELADGVSAAAGDVWGLGMTLIEALTQRVPGFPDDRSDPAGVAATLPVPFADTVRRCLARDPAKRPTVMELEARFKGMPLLPPHSSQSTTSATRAAPSLPAKPAPALVSAIAADEAPTTAAKASTAVVSPPSSNSAGRNYGAAAITATLAISLGAWVGFHLIHTHSSAAAIAGIAPSKPESESSAASAPPSAPAPSAEAPVSSGEPEDRAAALHEVIPEVPRAIREKVRGHINVAVRVLVDPSGDVVGQFLETTGPSRYFARIAEDAASGWRFAPVEGSGPRVWLLRFEFTRAGAAVQSAAAE